MKLKKEERQKQKSKQCRSSQLSSNLFEKYFKNSKYSKNDKEKYQQAISNSKKTDRRQYEKLNNDQKLIYIEKIRQQLIECQKKIDEALLDKRSLSLYDKKYQRCKNCKNCGKKGLSIQRSKSISLKKQNKSKGNLNGNVNHNLKDRKNIKDKQQICQKQLKQQKKQKQKNSLKQQQESQSDLVFSLKKKKNTIATMKQSSQLKQSINKLMLEKHNIQPLIKHLSPKSKKNIMVSFQELDIVQSQIPSLNQNKNLNLNIQEADNKEKGINKISKFIKKQEQQQVEEQKDIQLQIQKSYPSSKSFQMNLISNIKNKNQQQQGERQKSSQFSSSNQSNTVSLLLSKQKKSNMSYQEDNIKQNSIQNQKTNQKQKQKQNEKENEKSLRSLQKQFKKITQKIKQSMLLSQFFTKQKSEVLQQSNFISINNLNSINCKSDNTNSHNNFNPISSLRYSVLSQKQSKYETPVQNRRLNLMNSQYFGQQQKEKQQEDYERQNQMSYINRFNQKNSSQFQKEKQQHIKQNKSHKNKSNKIIDLTKFKRTKIHKQNSQIKNNNQNRSLRSSRKTQKLSQKASLLQFKDFQNLSISRSQASSVAKFYLKPDDDQPVPKTYQPFQSSIQRLSTLTQSILISQEKPSSDQKIRTQHYI